MKFEGELLKNVANLPAPSSSSAYFGGWSRRYFCAVDDVLLFARTQARDLRRRSAESHLHKRFVLVVCLEAGGTILVDGVPFKLRPGQAHLVFPQSYHHFIDLDASDINWLFVTFESKESERLAILRQRTISLAKEDVSPLTQLVQWFGRDSERRRGDELCATVGQMLAGWSLQTRERETQEPFLATQQSSGLWRRLQIELESLSPEELRVGPLARRLGISERHFRTRFLEQFGVSAGVYLRNYRIRRAIGFLASSELSMAEIADLCGYRSVSSFCKAFAKQTGVTPKDYRKVKEI